MFVWVAVMVWGCGSEDGGGSTTTDTASTTDTQETNQTDTASTADTQTAEDTTTSQDTPSADAPDALPPDTEFPYTRLSTYGFFVGNVADLTPAAGVIPYDVNAVLFADDSHKSRFLTIPEGTKITFNAEDRWVFPEGSTAIKHFFYPLDERDPSAGQRRLETRLLVMHEGRWRPYTYVWNDEQTEAFRLSTGDNKIFDRIDATGQTVTANYLIPDNNQCKNCHDQSRVTQLLGPITRQLNRTHDYGAGPVNQLSHMESLGFFDAPLPALTELPAQAVFTDEALPIEDRARSYLDVNCSHCHNPDGSASSTGLNLKLSTDREIDLGVCRRPFSAGHGSGDLSFDIVPGDPDASIMVFRMSSTDPEIKMPELPTRTVDQTGTGIIRAWIASMPSRVCD